MMTDGEARQLGRIIAEAVYAALERQRAEEVARQRASQQRYIEQALKATEFFIRKKMNES